MSPSTTARPYTCFRCLGQGEGPVGTRITSPQDNSLCIRAEQVGCIGRTVSCRGTNLPQHDPFLLLPGTEVSKSNFFPDVLFLLYR
jgi:hypothetical protein